MDFIVYIIIYVIMFFTYSYFLSLYKISNRKSDSIIGITIIELFLIIICIDNTDYVASLFLINLLSLFFAFNSVENKIKKNKPKIEINEEDLKEAYSLLKEMRKETEIFLPKRSISCKQFKRLKKVDIYFVEQDNDKIYYITSESNFYCVSIKNEEDRKLISGLLPAINYQMYDEYQMIDLGKSFGFVNRKIYDDFYDEFFYLFIRAFLICYPGVDLKTTLYSSFTNVGYVYMTNKDEIMKVLKEFK